MYTFLCAYNGDLNSWAYRFNVVFCSVAQQSKSGIGRALLTFLDNTTIRYTCPVGAEAASYTTHNTHNRRTSMFSARFEPVISAVDLRVRPHGHPDRQWCGCNALVGVCIFMWKVGDNRRVYRQCVLCTSLSLRNMVSGFAVIRPQSVDVTVEVQKFWKFWNWIWISVLIFSSGMNSDR